LGDWERVGGEGETGADFGKGGEDEAAAGDAGMGEGELGGLDFVIAGVEEVEIDAAG